MAQIASEFAEVFWTTPPHGRVAAVFAEVFAENWHVPVPPAPTIILAPLGSLYFGQGEGGYHTHTSATPGNMIDGGGAVTGTATSPEIDLTAYASGFSIFIEFDQFLDLRANPNDLIKIEILDAGSVVQTVSSAVLKAVGNGHVRADITAAAAGVAALSVRFSVDTVTLPDAGREGWYVKGCRLLAVES